MALLGNGYKLIADQFQADANQVKLIGVSFPVDGGKLFRGVFDTRADLVAAYLANDETIGSFAFVKTGDAPDTEAGYYKVVVNIGGNKTWLRAEESGGGDTRFHIDGETEWQLFIGQTPSYTATTITNANEPGTGTPLQLSSSVVFNITSIPENTVGIMVQGIKFRKYIDAQTSYDYYIWGFGTDDWASFTEPGEFVVTSWDFKLGGFGG
jgi:hypothetical protein